MAYVSRYTEHLIGYSRTSVKTRYGLLTNNSERLPANGRTNSTVGKAIIHDSLHELTRGDILVIVKPNALIVLIKETTPLITHDKKKGTQKIMARTGSLGSLEI